ncbi:hypothetical protein HDU87_005305 [Geranomyces variabilis]|uniref:Uncharacterized protein n=1 Tax=Geranomyces variabilis TaxID=109894 RepID=A0AAD5TIF4_9FUNG|nr:hypothetical protein HDU87_005305 [Geranomyces variabilis]
MADLQHPHAHWEFSLNTVKLLGNMDPIRRVEEWAVEVSKHEQVFAYAGSSSPSTASQTQDGPLPENRVTTPKNSPIAASRVTAPALADDTEGAQSITEESKSAGPQAQQQQAAVWGQLVPLEAGVPPIDLITESGDGTENRAPSYLVGRHPGCDVVLPFLSVSNRHCFLYKETGLNDATGCLETTVYIEEFSRNGTWVNGTLLVRRQRYQLECGDQISFARNRKDTLIFTLTGVEPPQPNFFDKYDLTERLKSGDFAVVWLAESRTSAEKVVVKVISRDSFDGCEDATFGRNLVAEAKFWEHLEHPHITSILEVLWDAENIYVVLEHANGGDLFEAIIEKKKLPEPIARDLMKQIFEAIQYLHAQNVTHRNLKLEKIFACETDDKFFNVQISDFVKPSILSEPIFTESLCSSPDYVAPEILKAHTTKGLGPVCNKAADMWSCGVILYICLCGYPPFSEELGPPSLQGQIMEGKVAFRLPWWSFMSQASLDLIMGLLTLDPSKRMTAEQALEHPWITLKHPTRDKSEGVNTSHMEYPPDYCWPKQVPAVHANRVVPALERPRQSHKRGVATAAEQLNIVKRNPLSRMTKASTAANWSATTAPKPSPIACRTRNAATTKAVPRSIRGVDITTAAQSQGKTPAEQLASAQEKRQQSLPTPATSVPDNDHDNGLPVQSQGSYCEPAALAVSQPRPVPRPGKRRAVPGAKRGLITPSGSSASLRTKTQPAADRGTTFIDIPLIEGDALDATASSRSPTLEIEVTPAPIMPPLRRSGRIRSAKKA